MADRSILGWDLPIGAEDSMLTGNGDNSDDEGDDDENDGSDGDGDDDKHGQLLMCLHSFGDISFGDGGAMIFWLPNKAIPKDPNRCNPSKFKFRHCLD